MVRKPARAPRLTANFTTGGVGLNEVETKSAFFGASYQFTDAMKLSLEGRYQEDYVVGRASSSLIAFGERPKTAQTPGEMLDSADPKVRLATIPIIMCAIGMNWLNAVNAEPKISRHINPGLCKQIQSPAK